MEIVYYPDMYLTSERLLKELLLCWGSIKTIVPPTEKAYADAYLSGEITHETHFPLEGYKAIYDLAGDRVIDFLEIRDEERTRASEQMLELLTKWNADTRFYDSLKIHSFEDLIGKHVEWYWFLHEKLEKPLIELMLEEHLVVDLAPGEIVGFQQVGKSYMSVIAAEVQNSRNIRLITDDEYYLAAKGPATLQRNQGQPTNDSYELVSLFIPQVFFDSAVLDRLSWKDILSMRQDLLPYAEAFYGEVERYQQEINALAAANRGDEAFAKFCEFCERVAASFRPFAKEVGKVLRLVEPETLGMLSGILLPFVELTGVTPNVHKVCEVATLASTIGAYSLSGVRRKLGFEYLENLDRSLRIAGMKDTITCLIPHGLREGAAIIKRKKTRKPGVPRSRS